MAGFGDYARRFGEYARQKLPGEQSDLFGNRINTGRGLVGAGLSALAGYGGGAVAQYYANKPIENWVNKYNPSYQGTNSSNPFAPSNPRDVLGTGATGYGGAMNMGDWNVSGGGSSGNFGPFGPGGGPNGMAQGGEAPNYQGSVNGQMPFNPSSPGLTGPATNVNTGGEAPPSGTGDLGFGSSGFGDWNVSGGASRPPSSGMSTFTGNRSGGTLGGGTAVDPSQWGQFGFGQSSPDVVGPMQQLMRMGGGMSEGAGVRGGGMNPALAAAYWRSRGGAQTGGGGQMTPTNTGIVPPTQMMASSMGSALRRPPIKKII